MEESTLKLENVCFSYEENVEVLHDVSFAISQGEIVVIAGPNGSGKTTLVRLMFDLLGKQSGDILVCGKSHRLAEAKKSMIYLPSDNVLPDFLTGNEYVRLLHRLYDREVNAELIARLVEYYSMGASMDKLIENYSHGMVKKVELIAAFALQPKMIVMDETLNGVDIKAREVSKVLIEKYAKKGGTVVMCTHDLELAQEIAQRAILLYQGKKHREVVLADGSETSLTALFREIMKFKDDQYEI